MGRVVAGVSEREAALDGRTGPSNVNGVEGVVLSCFGAVGAVLTNGTTVAVVGTVLSPVDGADRS